MYRNITLTTHDLINCGSAKHINMFDQFCQDPLSHQWIMDITSFLMDSSSVPQTIDQLPTIRTLFHGYQINFAFNTSSLNNVTADFHKHKTNHYNVSQNSVVTHVLPLGYIILH